MDITSFKNYWVYGICQPVGILTIKRNFTETAMIEISFS